MLARVRSFFAERKVLEVDTPMLSRSAPIDPYIEVMTIHLQQGEKNYLHTSPEHAMKRLLANGSGDIYQLSHVFREGEIGTIHNPEFSLIEWYRINLELQSLIEETLQLLQLFIESRSITYYSYYQLFKTHLNIDYRNISVEELRSIAESHSLPTPYTPWNKENYLHFLLSSLIEPQLKEFTIVHSYPPSQASLAQIFQLEEEKVAQRFEIYYNNIEIANGFHELSDPTEQRKRFQHANQRRIAQGKPPLPIDEPLLAALPQLPDCCGVAVGFDRLLMLKLKQPSIASILPFPWNN